MEARTVASTGTSFRRAGMHCRVWFERPVFGKIRYMMLPVEDEGRLHDADIRENFIERVFVNHRWLQLLMERPSDGQRALRVARPITGI